MGPLSLPLDHETWTASCLTPRSRLHSTHRRCLESICVLVSLVTKVGQSHMSPTNPPSGFASTQPVFLMVIPHHPHLNHPAGPLQVPAPSLAQDPLSQTSGVDCTFGASVLRITPGELLLSLSIRSVEPVNLSIAALAAKNADTTTAWSWASQEGCLSYHTFPRHQWSVLGGTTFQRETLFTV